MRVLWQKRRATVADVVEALGKPPLAYTTVLTMLRILEQKRIVTHVADGRTHIYRPLVEREDAADSAVTDILGSFFSNRKTTLALQLISEERPSGDELASIKELIARYEEDGA